MKGGSGSPKRTKMCVFGFKKPAFSMKSDKKILNVPGGGGITGLGLSLLTLFQDRYYVSVSVQGAGMIRQDIVILQRIIGCMIYLGPSTQSFSYQRYQHNAITSAACNGQYGDIFPVPAISE